MLIYYQPRLAMHERYMLRQFCACHSTEKKTALSRMEQTEISLGNFKESSKTNSHVARG